MGEKNGALWILVIIVAIAGTLVFMLNQFYSDALDVVWLPMVDVLNDVGVRLGEALSGGESGEPPVAE